MYVDHVHIDCHGQEAVRDVFVALLVLKAGWRLPFSQPDYWLHLADNDSPSARNEDPAATYPDSAHAVIHTWPRASGTNAGWVDHVCFRLDEDASAIHARVQALGFLHRESACRATQIAQSFVTGRRSSSSARASECRACPGNRACACTTVGRLCPTDRPGSGHEDGFPPSRE